ncbi:MAG: dipeptide epimerase [Phycisphaerae bacterium]|nr:MAG: dipeptide epimerase [Phycisphaerae bacterium]
MTLAVKRMTIYPLSFPLGRKVSHATSERAVSEPIVVAVELMNGVVGYGETLPREYVTGETNETVLELLQGEFAKELLAFSPEGFPEALEAIDALPCIAEDGSNCSAARACVELALLDAVLRSEGQSLDGVTGWLGDPKLGSPGSEKTCRFSMVLASNSISSIARTVRYAKWAGIRNFKLKVGMPDDDARIESVMGVLGGLLGRGKATLRLDANGVWDVDQAADAVKRWRHVPLSGIEQPLSPSRDNDLVELKRRVDVPIFHDESLSTFEDAERLFELGVADGFNIRISKCGGLLASLKLASIAIKRKIQIQLGCMVGETSLLSGAGVRFLQMTPGVRFAEGSFGPLLSRHDIAPKRVRFTWGGKLPKLNEQGLGVDVSTELLSQHVQGKPIVIEL